MALGVLGVGGLAGLLWFMFVEPDLTWRVYAVNFAFGGISLVVAAELRAMPDKGPIERILIVLAAAVRAEFHRPDADRHRRSMEPTDSYDGFFQLALLDDRRCCRMRCCRCSSRSACSRPRRLMSSRLAVGIADRPAFGTAQPARFRGRRFGSSRACLRPWRSGRADRCRSRPFQGGERHIGHDAGDKVIAGFAERLRMAAGVGAIAGRIGGEEFAVLLTADRSRRGAAFRRRCPRVVFRVHHWRRAGRGQGDRKFRRRRRFQETKACAALTAPRRRGALSCQERWAGRRAPVLSARRRGPAASRAASTTHRAVPGAMPRASLTSFLPLCGLFA